MGGSEEDALAKRNARRNHGECDNNKMKFMSSFSCRNFA